MIYLPKKEDYFEEFIEQTTEYYTKGFEGDDIGVQLFDYYELNEIWPHICYLCQIPFTPLPHLNTSQ